MVVAAVDKTAKQSTTRAPLRSRYDPIEGDKIAASTPPKETAPEIAVRDQPNSVVIGVTKIDNVATAGPCRENPAKQTLINTTQP